MNKSKNREWTDSEIKILKEHYLDYTLLEFNYRFIPYRSKISIRNKAHRIGLKKKKGGKRKYKVNYEFFEEINFPENAYWLGFIFADGSISKRGLFFCLSDKDRNHIEKLKENLSEHPIKSYRKNVVEYRVYSPKLAEQLRNLGLMEKKTKRLKFPHLPNEYVRDFIRGYIDGDGSITIDERKNESGLPRVILRILGSKAFLQELNSYIKRILDIKRDSEVRKESNADVYSINYFGRKIVPKILDWIYYKDCVCLKRKRMKFEAYKKISEVLEN